MREKVHDHYWISGCADQRNFLLVAGSRLLLYSFAVLYALLLQALNVLIIRGRCSCSVMWLGGESMTSENINVGPSITGTNQWRVTARVVREWTNNDWIFDLFRSMAINRWRLKSSSAMYLARCTCKSIIKPRVKWGTIHVHADVCEAGTRDIKGMQLHSLCNGTYEHKMRQSNTVGM
jgi:hypothetical protein